MRCVKERNLSSVIFLIILNIPLTLISNLNVLNMNILNMVEAQMLTIAEIQIKIRNSTITMLEYLTFLTPRSSTEKDLIFRYLIIF
jgi:hypothetical protein